MSTLIAYSNSGKQQGSAPVQPDGYAQKLYQYKGTYTGDIVLSLSRLKIPGRV